MRQVTRYLLLPWLGLCLSGTPLPAQEADPPKAPAAEPAPPGAEPAPAEPGVEAPIEPTEPPPAAQPAAAAAQSAALAPDDRVVFIRDGNLWVVRGDGSGLRPLTNTVQRESHPAGSPDGETVLYELYDGDFNEYVIWQLSIENGATRELLREARNPSWSPDGGRILFVSGRAGGLDIWLANRDGSDLLRLTSDAASEFLPCWAPGGGEIAFVRQVGDRGGGRETLIIARDSLGNERELANLGERSVTGLAWAPASDLLVTAKETHANSREQVYRLSREGGVPEQVVRGFDELTQATWTSAPPAVLFVENRNGRTRLTVQPEEGASFPLAGSVDGDSEPSVLPGLARRAPHVYIHGRRSFYLPSPRLQLDDVLVPAADLARQLWLTLEEGEGQELVLSRDNVTVIVDLIANEARVGDEVKPLAPPATAVAGVPLLPARAIAALFGITSEWQPEQRIVRIGS